MHKTLIFIVLSGLLAFSPLARGQCTIPTYGDACPARLPTGDCSVSAEWFQQNEPLCKGKPHAAIELYDTEGLRIGSANVFKVDLNHFKKYPIDVSTGTCNDNSPTPNMKAPLSDDDPGHFGNAHVLTAQPVSTDDTCYGVMLYIVVGSSTITVDPHIIIHGSGQLRPPKVHHNKGTAKKETD